MESNGPWALLGIAPTRQTRDIKRAYAARLKIVRPDDDPAGFQALRQAYEWALGQSSEQPAPAPVVYLQFGPQAQPAHPIEIDAAPPLVPDAPPPPAAPLPFGPQAQPTYQIKIEPAPQTPPAPDARAQPEPLPIHWGDVPSHTLPAVRPSKSGDAHWSSFLADIGGENADDASDAHIEALAAQLRACLRHDDLVHFDTREAFANAALSACADEHTPGALRLACDTVFDWSHAPMPLDPWARARWSDAIEHIAGERQYREMQALAQDAEPRRWVLQQLTQAGAPEIPWRRFFDRHFRLLVRDSLRRVRTDWPLALRFRLNAASLPILEEAANRPWPSIKPSKPTWFALALIPVVTLALVIFEPHPSRLIPGGVVLLVIGTLVALRAAYPLWLIPAWRRLRQRAGSMHASLRVWWSYQHKAQRIWFAVRIAALSAAFLAPLLPPWYADGVCVAIGATAALHISALLLLGEIGAWFALLARALVIYGLPLGWTFRPLIGERPAFYLVLLLADTLFYGLRDVLRQSNLPTWDTPRARWMVLAGALVLLPLQWQLASPLPILANLLGWGWFIAGCAAVDAFAPRATVKLPYVIKFYLGVCLSGISFGAGYALFGENSPITGIISLQTAIVIVTLITLADDWLTRRKHAQANRTAPT